MKTYRNGNDNGDGNDSYDISSILCRAFGILLVAGLLTFVLSSISPFHPSLALTGNDEDQNQTQNQHQAQKKAQKLQSLSPEEERIVKLPTDVLTEVLDICIYFSWKTEDKNVKNSATAPFDKEEYNSRLPIPSFLVNENEGHEAGGKNKNVNEEETTTIGAIATSSSTSLLRYVAMRGELYPLTTSDDGNAVMIENLDQRMLQALYVDELLERMKNLESYLVEQLDAIKSTTTTTTTTTSPSDSVRGAQEDSDLQKLVTITVREMRKYLDFAERLLAGHLDPTFFSNRNITVADIVLYSLANRLFTIVGNRYQGDKLIQSLDGTIQPQDYPRIEEALGNVSKDRTVEEFFAQQ